MLLEDMDGYVGQDALAWGSLDPHRMHIAQNMRNSPNLDIIMNLCCFGIITSPSKAADVSTRHFWVGGWGKSVPDKRTGMGGSGSRNTTGPGCSEH